MFRKKLHKEGSQGGVGEANMWLTSKKGGEEDYLGIDDQPTFGAFIVEVPTDDLGSYASIVILSPTLSFGQPL